MNDFGQLADGTTLTRRAPILVPGVNDAIEAHGGRGYTVLRRTGA
jgi:hypothetical protein